jgi:hypothetical protein
MFGIDDVAAAGLIGAGANFVGGMLTNQANKDIAASNNEWSAAQYASRYQTQVKDLQAAGLNPMLSYSQSPGSSPTAQQVQFQNPVSSAVDAYDKTTRAQSVSAQIQNVNADTRLKEAQANLAATQQLAAEADERLKTTSANEATYRLWSQQNVQNPTQKALAASYWSQIDVNKATLPKIVQEIKTGGAYAAQAMAAARKGIADAKISEADLVRAWNEADFESSKLGKSKRYIDYGINSAGKIVNMVPRTSTSTTTRTSPWGVSSSTTTTKGR